MATQTGLRFALTNAVPTSLTFRLGRSKPAYLPRSLIPDDTMPSCYPRPAGRSRKQKGAGYFVLAFLFREVRLAHMRSVHEELGAYLESFCELPQVVDRQGPLAFENLRSHARVNAQ